MVSNNRPGKILLVLGRSTTAVHSSVTFWKDGAHNNPRETWQSSSHEEGRMHQSAKADLCHFDPARCWRLSRKGLFASKETFLVHSIRLLNRSAVP